MTKHEFDNEVFLPAPLLNNTSQGIRDVVETLDWSDMELSTLRDFADFVETEAKDSGVSEWDIIWMFWDDERKGLSLELPDGEA